MNAEERRKGIISFVSTRKHCTTSELAREFDVSTRTIKRDVIALSFLFPIYTKAGLAGGVYWNGGNNPRQGLLSLLQMQTLLEIYRESHGDRRRIIKGILYEFGATDLRF